MSEQRVYEYGIAGLDNLHVERITSPGTAPGMITAVTGVTGSGLSIFLANVVLGVARSARRVCVGSWDRSITLERLARISSAARSPDDIDARMSQIAARVSFVDSSSFNLIDVDRLSEIIEASKCDVFVADTIDRICSVDPREESQILYRLSDMANRLKIHLILGRRQSLREASLRGGRPTLGGIRGSSTLPEIADTVFGIHTPGRWHEEIANDRLDVFILKQRWAKWPMRVTFDVDFNVGALSNGRLVANANPDDPDGVFFRPRRR